MTNNEFRLRVAKNMLPRYPERAAEFLEKLLQETVDPRLQSRVIAILRFIAQQNYDAADRWIDRALAYEERRRRRIDFRFMRRPLFGGAIFQ